MFSHKNICVNGGLSDYDFISLSPPPLWCVRCLQAWSCQQQCGKLLPCKQHACTQPCHTGKHSNWLHVVSTSTQLDWTVNRHLTFYTSYFTSLLYIISIMLTEAFNLSIYGTNCPTCSPHDVRMTGTFIHVYTLWFIKYVNTSQLKQMTVCVSISECSPCPRISVQRCVCGRETAERLCASPQWNCQQVRRPQSCDLQVWQNFLWPVYYFFSN